MSKLLNLNLLFVCVFLGFIGNYLIVNFWQFKNYSKFGLNKYEALQKIYDGDVPRLGGFVFFLIFFIYFLFNKLDNSNLLIRSILIPLIPILLIGLKEDLFHHTDPNVRLLFIIFSGWLFIVFYLGPYPNMTNVPIISKIFSLQSGASFFFILSIAAMVNAMNLIDGVNGLCGFVTISILTSLLFISYNTHDDLMIKTIVSTILLLIPFLVFNFPDGKIFLGDMGSYGFGALISILVIMIFGRHPNLSVWLAPFIIIYPLTELIFTIGRRFISKSFIFSPDLKHLHTLVFKAKFLQYKKSKNMKNINGMVAPYLSFLWLFPSLIIFYDYENARLVSIAALFFIVMYLFTYFSFNDR